MIYLVIKSKWVKLLVDIVVCEDFTTESVRYFIFFFTLYYRYTNRAFFMTMLHTAFEYLENLTKSDIEALKAEMKEHSVDINLYKNNDFLNRDTMSLTIFWQMQSRDEEVKEIIEESKDSIIDPDILYYKERRAVSHTLQQKNDKAKNILELNIEFYNSGIRRIPSDDKEIYQRRKLNL
jgi:hypothetical protein